MNSRMTSVYFCCALALALPSVFRGQSCTITSPTASQLILGAQPLQLTATVSSAPTAYSLEYDIDYRRWRKAYNDDQHPKIGDFGDNYQGPWVATWYSGLYGDGPHVVSGTLRDIFGATLATCPAISFTVRVEGMSSQTINELPNQSGNTISGIGAFGVLTFTPTNVLGTPVWVDGRVLPQTCGAAGGSGQTGGWQDPAMNTTCGFPNGPHLISAGYGQTNISDPLILGNAISSVSGTSINFGTCGNPRGPTDPGCHYSVQTTATNPDVVTFSTTGAQYTGVSNGQQYYWQTGSSDGTATQSRSGTTIVLALSPSASVTITPGTTPVYVRNLGYTNQVTGLNSCDGLYTAATGSTSSTINLAMSSSPTCPSGTVTAAIAGNPTIITLSGTLPTTRNVINIMGLTGGSWASFNGQWQVTQLTTNTFSVNWDSSTYGTLTGSGTFAATLSYTANVEVDINPYFANYIDSSHISISASPSGSSPISLSGSCTGTCTVHQRIRSPYWGGANSNATLSAMPDYAANGAPAVVTQQVTFSNGSSPMEIRPPYWEYHGWPGKTGDTLAAIIENTDLSSSACGGGCSYSVTADGTVSGAISVNTSTGAITYNPTSSWSNPSAPTAWAQATVTCTTCSVGVTSVTVYIEEDPGASSVYPHWTTCGTIVTTFAGGSPGSCHSFYPLSLQDASVVNSPGWLGPGVFQNGHFNSTMASIAQSDGGYALMNPTSGSCPTWPDATMTTEEAFAAAYGIQLEFDLQTIWFNSANGYGSNGGGLPVILANTGYNRRACLTALVSHMVATGRYWRFYNDDESSFIQGVILRMNPTIQASLQTADSGWTQAVVSGSSLIFTVQNPITLAGNWSQSAGTGAWIEIVNAANSCLNGWYPINNNTSTQWTTNNNGSCANGTYKPSGGTTETTAQMVLNPSYLNGSNNNQQNVSALPSKLSAVTQTWDTNLTSIVVSSCVATAHWTGNLIPNGNAIRIWQATSANLNIVAPITSGTNTFTFTYPNTTGEACPANGTYNSSTDSNLMITVDPNWGPDPLLQFYNIVDAVSGHPTRSYTMLGNLFGTPASVYSYMGNSTNVDSSFVYLGNSANFYLGDSAGVFNWMNGDTSVVGNPGGLATRAYQLKPRSVLWGWGVVNGGASLQTTCRSFTFNPGCDRPEQLLWRPEDIIAQIMGYKTHDYAALRNYNLASDTLNGYVYFCCGWQAGGTGAGNGNSPYIAPKAFKAAALANALLTLRTETELQPEANKPYFGPYFTTDAHFSATYGNELQIVCGSESPYGSFQVKLPQISGGSMLKYILTGYSLSMSVLAGNPGTDTDEFCGMPGNPSIAAPARTTTYVALPPSPPFQPADRISFSAPATLPFGASKFLLQVGYYQPEMQDDPVTDCTSGCTIAIDHHDMAAWYRVIYADSNNQPRSIGDPVQIPSQGLY